MSSRKLATVRRMTSRNFSPCLLIGIAIVIAIFSSPAQESTNPPPPKTVPDRRPLDLPGRPPDGFGLVMNILTAEQRTSLAQALQMQRETLRTLELQLRDARRDLIVASVSTNSDETSVTNHAHVIA